MDLDGHALGFGLRDILRLLGPRGEQAELSIISYVHEDWDAFEAHGCGGEKLRALADTPVRLPGTELAVLANDTSQVVWGVFNGHLDDPSQPWVSVRAMDSSFYEVATKDTEVLSLVRGAFRDVIAV